MLNKIIKKFNKFNYMLNLRYGVRKDMMIFDF